MATYSRSTLYQRFESDCVSREEFSKLVDSKVLPQQRTYLFPLFSSIGDGKNTPKFSGSTAKELAEKGELLFFENWLAADYERKYAPLHMGCYVYQDFMVICAEPDFNSDTNGFGPNYDIDPVAIPLSRVTTITASHGMKRGLYGSSGQDDYCITISFAGKSSFTAKLFWDNPFWRCLVHDNWSSAVNGILLKTAMGVQNTLADTIATQIKSALEDIVRKCTDYEKRYDSIKNLFNEPVAQTIEENIYTSKHFFVKLLVRNRNALKSNEASQALKEELNNIAAAIENSAQAIASLQEEMKNLENAIFKAEMAKSQAGLFKKAKYKKEIEELTEQKEQVLSKIKSLDVPENSYSEAMNCYMVAANYVFEKEEEKSWSESDTALAKQLCAECQKRHLTEIHTNEDMLLLEMIGKQQGIQDVKRAKELFDYGTTLMEQPTPSGDDSNDRKKRVALENEYIAAKENSQIIGWDKYLTGYYKRIQNKQKELAELGVSYDLGINHAANSSSKPVDWAIMGGLAQGIAGPAAGIMAAADVQRRNAQSAVAAQKARDDGIKLAAYSSILAKKAEGELQSILKEVENIKKRLYDADHPEIFFGYLSCEILSYEIVMRNVMKVTVDIWCKKKAEFSGVPIVIDGSIAIEIMDGDTVVANAFICPDGFGCTDFERVGFSDKKTYSAVAKTIDNFIFNENKQYNFRFRPEHIWMIEK